MKQLPNILHSGSTLKTTRAEIIMYAIARVPTAINDSFDFLNTATIIFTLFEYLNILNALKTLKALAILNTLKSLKPLFKTEIDGKIETISIIAKTPNGYRAKETKDFLLYL